MLNSKYIVTFLPFSNPRSSSQHHKPENSLALKNPHFLPLRISAKPQENSSPPLLLHHLNHIVSSLQHCFSICKARLPDCYIKHHQWQFKICAISCLAELGFSSIHLVEAIRAAVSTRPSQILTVSLTSSKSSKISNSTI